MEEKMRLQLELSEARVRVLDALMEDCGITTRKDLFNNALAMLEWAVKERKRGNIIASVNENEQKYRELQMPIFAEIAASESQERPTLAYEA
jgi:hypothetical protein